MKPTRYLLACLSLVAVLAVAQFALADVAGVPRIQGVAAGAPVIVAGTVTSTPSGAAQPVTGTFWQATQPVSLTGQSVTSTQGGTWSVTATQGTGSNLHTVVDSGSVTATLAAGSAVTSTITGITNGQKAMAASFPVVLASDQSALACTQSGSWSLAANQSVNVAQINGVAASMGNGASGTGVQRVTLASDSTGQVALAAGTSVTSTGPLAQASTTAGQKANLVLAATATSTPALSGSKSNPLSQLPDGHLRVTEDGDLQTSATSTTATTATQWIAASGSNRTFVKFAQCSSSAASTTTTNEQCQLVYGTGTNCGTGTTLLAACFTPATGGCNWHDLVAPASQAICFRHAVAGTKLYVISYRQAP